MLCGANVDLGHSLKPRHCRVVRLVRVYAGSRSTKLGLCRHARLFFVKAEGANVVLHVQRQKPRYSWPSHLWRDPDRDAETPPVPHMRRNGQHVIHGQFQ